MQPQISKVESGVSLDLAATSFPVRIDRPDWYPQRFFVPEEFKNWNVSFPEYAPSHVRFQNEGKPNKGWDPIDLKEVTRPFNSFTGEVKFDAGGRPLNPLGRTGIQGAGELWFWGANFAADPIITRISPKTGRLEAILIQRKDTGDLAIPGGMVDASDMNISKTLARELGEETSAELDMEGATILFRGVVNDRRNTDNRWIETTVAHRHLTEEQAAEITLKEGDDAKAVDWIDLTPRVVDSLYADHGKYVRLALEQVAKSGSVEVNSEVVREQLSSFYN